MSTVLMDDQVKYLDKLRSKLRRNDQKRISKETGFSSTYISMVLNGHKKNQEILCCAIKIVEEHQILFDQNTEKLAAL